jgi:hypothetical protein
MRLGCGMPPGILLTLPLKVFPKSLLDLLPMSLLQLSMPSFLPTTTYPSIYVYIQADSQDHAFHPPPAADSGTYISTAVIPSPPESSFTMETLDLVVVGAGMHSSFQVSWTIADTQPRQASLALLRPRPSSS